MEEVKKEEDENTQALNFIWSNINAAQSRTGAFTLEDCEEVIKAHTLLSAFLKSLHAGKNNESNESIIAGKVIFNAYEIVLSAVRLQQSKGIYTIEGSVEILKNLKLLKSNLDLVKDPSLKLKELKEKSKIIKSKPKKDK